jgi:S1-C subfamily serine protease
VLVLDVEPGDPADEAGVEAGDIITQIGEFELNAQTTFSEALFNYAPGDTVELTIVRGDETITLEITLGDRGDNL